MIEVGKKKKKKERRRRRKIDSIYVKVHISYSSKGQLLYLEVLGKLI